MYKQIFLRHSLACSYEIVDITFILFRDILLLH
jgi:hypothetical protein